MQTYGVKRTLAETSKRVKYSDTMDQQTLKSRRGRAYLLGHASGSWGPSLLDHLPAAVSQGVVDSLPHPSAPLVI